MKKRLYLALALTAMTLAGEDDRNNLGLQARPSIFAGTAAGCGLAPPGSNVVTSAWLTGLGLPDNGTMNITPARPANRDDHFGLLLSKNGATSDCSAASARIRGVEEMRLIELGFDYRNGGHCGAGAPRFNLVTMDNVLHFVGGCANGTKTPAPQNPAEWTRVRFNLSTLAVPPLAPGARIKSLSIIFDEGTDMASADDPLGVALAVVDNIAVNGVLIRRGTNRPGDREDDDDDREDNDKDRDRDRDR